MDVLKKTIVCALAIFFFGASASPALAQEAQNEYDQHVDECQAGRFDDRMEMADKLKSNSYRDELSEEDKKVLDERSEEKWKDSFAGKFERFSCRATQAIKHPVAAVSAGASKFWGDPVGDFTKAVLEGNNEALQTVMTFWMDWRLDKNVVEGSVQGIKNIVLGIAGMALISSLIVGGMQMSYDRRQGIADGLEGIGKNLGSYLIWSTLIIGLGAGAMVASDQLSDWIMKQFGASDAETVLGASELNEKQAGPILMLALAGVGVAGSCMQIVSLATRSLIFPIALGITPALAAFSYTNTGRQGLNHVTSLLIACVLFKPVSALLYCVAFWQSANGGEDFMSAVMTVLMLAAAGFSGPTLVRSIAPFVAQAGGGGAGAALAGGASLAGGAASVVGTVGGAIAGGAGGAFAGAKAGAPAKAAGSSGSGGGGGSPLSGGGSGGGSPLGGGSGPRGGGSGGGSPASDTTAAGAGQGTSGGRAVSPGGSGSTASSTSGSEGASVRPASSGAPSGGGAPGGARGSNPSRRRTMSGVGARARGAGRGVVSGARRGASRGRGMGAPGARAGRAAGSAARQIQGILDESIGQQGNYHGSVRR